MLSAGKKKFGIKSILVILLLVIIVFYFTEFFTRGVFFKNIFLKKQVYNNQSYYRGNSDEGHIEIIVNGLLNSGKEVELNYKFENQSQEKYIVEFKDANNWEKGVAKVLDSKRDVLFEGSYSKDRRVLYDRDGMPVFSYKTGNNQSYYKTSLYNIVKMASYHNDTYRGNFSEHY